MVATVKEGGLKNLRASLRFKDSDDEEEHNSQQKTLDSALCIAVQEGDVREVLNVLEKGANANTSSRGCEPPLIEAFIACDIDTAAALLLHSADPLQFSLSGTVLTELVSDSASKMLLDFFTGGDVDEESKRCVLSRLDKFMRWRVARKLAEFEEQKRRLDKQKPSSLGRRQEKCDEKLSRLQKMAENKARSLAGERVQAVVQSSTPIPEVRDIPRSETSSKPQPASKAEQKPISEATVSRGSSTKEQVAVREDRLQDFPTEVEVAALQEEAERARKAKEEEAERAAAALQEEAERVVAALQEEAERARKEKEARALNSGYHPADLDSEQPLIAATRCGDIEKVKSLLNTKIDPNVQDEIGETPLFEAVVNGDINAVAALLLGKGDPSWRSPAGVQPRDLASSSSSAISLLLDLEIWSDKACRDENVEKVISEVSDEDIRQKLLFKILHLQEHDLLTRQINARH